MTPLELDLAIKAARRDKSRADEELEALSEEVEATKQAMDEASRDYSLAEQNHSFAENDYRVTVAERDQARAELDRLLALRTAPNPDQPELF
jgi:chromosome segregation ATPase